MFYYAVTSRYTPVGEHSEPTLWPPTCAERGVTFVLFQKHTESPFVRRTTRAVSGAARCTATGDWIPAMAWTDEMERAFLGAKATADTAPASFRFRSEFVRVLAVVLAIAIPVFAAIIWFATRPNAYQLAEARIAAVAAAPAVGDAVQAQDASGGTPVYRWYVIRRITDAEVDVQASTTSGVATFEIPTPESETFSGPVETIPRAQFLADGRLGVGGAPGMPDLLQNAVSADG